MKIPKRPPLVILTLAAIPSLAVTISLVPEKAAPAIADRKDSKEADRSVFNALR